MTDIVLGKSEAGTVRIPLRTLLRTRMLVQAASGGGKSKTLRRMGEQLYGKVPTFIIDRDGEFPSLREKLGYVLVGKGGETPADPRSAELVCYKLLEHNASAVFDLYDLKDPDRHRWVKVFIDALMNAPKSLWKNTVVMVDEAHRFCCEKGQGESEATASLVDLATDGRKRGFCPIYLTQRLAKLSKNASAELLNRLIGKTIEDMDLDRAGDLMSVRRADRHEFEDSLKKMKPGHFWAFGEALSYERTLVHVGPCVTTHPEPGSKEASAAPPPLPEKMKALLPKLADLPKEAEEKAKTTEELRKKVKALEFELLREKARTAAPTKVTVKEPPKVVTEVRTVEVPVLGKRDANHMRKAIEEAKVLAATARDIAESASSTLAKLTAKPSHAPQSQPLRREFVGILPKVQPAIEKVEKVEANGEGDGELSNPQRRILDTVSTLYEMGVVPVPKPWISGWMGNKICGSFNNNVSALRTGGYLEYDSNGVVLTPKGGEVAKPNIPGNQQDIEAHCVRMLSNPEGEILHALFEAYPVAMTREDIALTLGKAVSGSFKNNISSIHTDGFVEYEVKDGVKRIRYSPWLMGQVEAPVFG